MVWTGSTWATPPAIIGTWDTAGLRIGFHESIPNECIEQALFAATAWNNAGANFKFDVDISGRHPRRVDQTEAFDSQNITFESGSPQNLNAVMAARIGWVPGTPTINNADVIVDKRRLEEVPSSVIKLTCAGVTATPPDRTDFQSAALHELGHTVGLDDINDDASCSMYKSLNPGVWRRGLCTDEMQAYINNYDRFRIVSITNVAGPYYTAIPVTLAYSGKPKFPMKRSVKPTTCPSGWTCDNAGSETTYATNTPSPLTFNFSCHPSQPMPTATFGFRTTLTDADGKITNAFDHSATCTASAQKQALGKKTTATNRVKMD
ncbi:hypothetical protein [Pseudomonas sp. CGJS7]|uniref:hypothetical protein n=1 Tax=Pseudomonas sp. CGJS7 TaxID=3109348 RepID=UPI0030093799